MVDGSQSLNPFVTKRSVKLDHLHRILPELPADSWFVTMDLSNGYYHIKVHDDHKKLLGVRWTLTNGKTVLYQWKVTFLGISNLIHQFTKLLIPNKMFLFKHGILSFIYIDDQIIVGSSREDCLRKREFARKAWRAAGSVQNVEKGSEPAQRGVFLGLEIDTRSRTVWTPEEKAKIIDRRLKDIHLRKK